MGKQEKTRCGCCSPPQRLPVAAGKPLSRGIASACPGTGMGHRRAGLRGTARTGSGHPGSHTGPSTVTLQS